MPHKGWTCKSVFDNTYADFKCEACNNANVRFVHCLIHPDFDGQLKVGCECSEKMSKNYSVASQVEEYSRNYENKKFQWDSKPWMKIIGGQFKLVHEEYEIFIYQEKSNSGYFKVKLRKEERSNIDDGLGPEQVTETVEQILAENFVSVTEAQIAVRDFFLPRDINCLLNF